MQKVRREDVGGFFVRPEDQGQAVEYAFALPDQDRYEGQVLVRITDHGEEVGSPDRVCYYLADLADPDDEVRHALDGRAPWGLRPRTDREWERVELVD